jgi:DNA-binding response OmpR family regulator
VKILLVEDDLPLAQGLQTSLKNESFAVNHVATGKEALLALAVPEHDMVILDLGLPDIDGYKILHTIKQKKINIPTLILTARDSIDDKVKGLDLGADDYLVKPFNLEELTARLRVIERRLGTAKSSIIQIKNVAIDLAAHKVFIDDNDLMLSKKEYMVAKVLIENAGRILSRSQIETKLYEWGEEVASNAVEVHVHNIRKKLPKDFIKTVRGVGYTVNKK